GRNLLNVRASDAAIFIGGSMGTMNELTMAYDEEKIIGIFLGSGGFCNHFQEWLPALAKPGNRSVIVYASEPEALVQQIFTALRSKL
ncbi:MAG TPA: hypothetical protein VLH08_04825, partial [Acidobacteriota bacterium]|nr:hypothetical protein [Acidobacteriota bacterium]